MPTHDYVIANGTGSSVRSDINDALSAIVSQNSSSTAPATTYAYMIWVDTTTNIVKMRNGANSAWIDLFETDGEFGSKTFNGNITLNAQGDLRFGDSDSSNWVAFQAPGTVSSNVTWTLPSADGTSGQALTTNGSGTLSWTTPSASSDIITEGNTSAEVVDTGSDGHFKVTTEGTEAIRVDASRRLLVGTTSPVIAGSKVEIKGNGDGSGTGGKLTIAATDNWQDSGSLVGAIYFANNSGGTPATIKAEGDGFGGSNDYPGRLVFSTTADGASSPTERCRIDSSGRLLVGTSSSVTRNGYAPNLQVEATGIGAGAALARYSDNQYGPLLILSKSRGSIGANTVVANNDELGTIVFAGADGVDQDSNGASIAAFVDGTPGSNDMPGRIVLATTADGASSPTERMRITSGGDFYFNTTVSTKTTDGFRVENGGIPNVARGTSGTFMQFFHSGSGSQIGSITNNGGTATAYNTSSDYRLKENVTAVTDGITRLQQLKPSRFNFIANPDKTVDGFIAHEVQTVVPEAITGEKDAVDDEGNPVYQGIDQSKLVPLLTAALQEAVQRIETLETANASLEARLTALENA